jgi:hypothetical protein
MAYTVDLTGSWAKLKWAKRHINQLRQEIAEAGKPNPESIPLRRQFEPDEVRDHWGLIVGDAVHNLRSALDHLAWQLALRHFNGVVPTDRKIVRYIQFPIVSDKNDWPTHIHRKYMDPADADKLEQFQPFHLGPISRARGHFHPTEGLALLSDIDKHRLIHLPYLWVVPGSTRAPGWPEDYRDCVPQVGPSGRATLFYRMPDPSPHAGDEVARFLVIRTGPNPDVELNTSLTGYVAIRESWDVIDALDAFAEGVSMILKTF